MLNEGSGLKNDSMSHIFMQKKHPQQNGIFPCCQRSPTYMNILFQYTGTPNETGNPSRQESSLKYNVQSTSKNVLFLKEKGIFCEKL
jgi:hypothetical protein